MCQGAREEEALQKHGVCFLGVLVWDYVCSVPGVVFQYV